MSEKTIDTGTAVGKTAMIQVLSAIAIIVCTLFFGVPGSDILGMMFAGILYVIGFLQLLVTRYLLQKETQSILVAMIVAILAMVFSFGTAIFWGVLLNQWTQGSFYLFIVGINLPIVAILRSAR